MLTNFNTVFYNDDVEKEYKEVLNNNFKELFPEVNNTYDISLPTAQSITGRKYNDVMHETLKIVQDGELKHSPYRDFHARAWLKIIHAECGSSFIKLMNEFKKLNAKFDEDEITWNKVFYKKQHDLGMD